MEAPEFWKKRIDDLYSELSTSSFGLSTKDAKERLAKQGRNEIPDKDKKEWLDILISQIKSPFLLILIFASIVSGYLGLSSIMAGGPLEEISDTAIILLIVVASVALGFFQEYKSEKVLTELKKYFTYHAVVLRDGEKGQVDSRELVPGDVVFVGLGDIVPADLRLIETSGILANESLLTGESREVRKDADASPGSGANPQDIGNGLFMGSTVVEGYAKCLVIATGQNTFFGKTASVFSLKVPETDFQTGIRKFGDMVIRVIVVMTLLVFFFNILGGRNSIADSALFALALAVGVAPEALPAVITVTLSTGSMHLAKKKVITKKLAAIEDLGNMDVLCTDKTGTLTEESLRMDKYVDLDKRDSHDVFQYALLCNSAVGTGNHIKGNAIDVAIAKRGHSLKTDLSHFKKIQEIQFDFNRRRMSQVVQEGRKRYLVVKGAPESVISICTKVRTSSKLYSISEKESEIKEMIACYNREGHSTIAIAYKDIDSKAAYSKDDEKDMVFIGFVLFSNPPKPTVRMTLERLKKLNIRLKVLTGDDPLVTKKLCSEVGFEPAEGRIVLGSELRAMNPEEFSEAAQKFDVFARVAPDQKLAIVEALRAKGHVVGFMGDGINDAPALRTADVGISVNTAADVAKGASHIILLKKSLGVVCDGVEEGRRIFGNITKYIHMVISANNGNMATVVISSIFLPFIPMLPTQILLNNLVADLPMLSIAGDNVDKEYSERPRKWNIGFIVKFMLFFGFISTFFDLLLIGIMYFVLHSGAGAFRTAWFVESLLSEIMLIFSLRTSLPFFRSMPSHLLALSSVAAGIIALAVVYVGPIANLFQFEPLGTDLILTIAGILVLYFIAAELGKVVFYKKIATAKDE